MTTEFLTRLHPVERDGNPLRRTGHVSPFIGKLAPLDSAALRAIARHSLSAMPPLPDPTLVIGMTESSLLLSWFLAEGQEPPVDLRFTTREERSTPGRSFREPHSHGPQHFIALEAGRQYAQIIIIEDELTTGATLRNLILAVRDVSSRIFVLTLYDGRAPELRDELQQEMANLGEELTVIDLSRISAPAPSTPAMTVSVRNCNPFGRSREAIEQAARNLQNAWNETQPAALYIIGECVDVALKFWESLASESCPEIRQITRSPWKVDGEIICTRDEFEGDGDTSKYFFYNWQPPASRRAILVGEESTSCIARQAQEFLTTRGVTSRIVTVSAA